MSEVSDVPEVPEVPEASDVPEVLQVPTRKVILWGMVGWLVALAVVLAVPALHEGVRSWWPWACVSGLALGVVGFAYVARGRGNAASAE